MSLPGVETARRRRVSHGRSAVGFVQPPPLGRRSCAFPASPASFNSSLRVLDPADRYGEILNERAIAARHRLDERLFRDPATCTRKPNNSRHPASLIPSPRPHEARPLAFEKKLESRRVLTMREEKFVPGLSELGGGQQPDDCPVCLDSFLAGQTVLHLPCRHAFHTHCIDPWLQKHRHCPSCRAHTS